MSRTRAVSLGALVLVFLFTMHLDAPLVVNAANGCRLALSDEADVTAPQVVRAGEGFQATYSARAVRGDWSVDTTVAAEHGRIQGSARDAELNEGEEREIAVRFQVGDVPEGTFSVGIFVRGECLSGNERERKTYSFEVTVAEANPGDLADPTDDRFLRASGQAAGTPDAIDLIRAEATLDGNSIRFRLSFPAPLPDLEADAPIRVGCYLDTFGTASLRNPFDPRGFERLALVSWVSHESSPRVEDVVRGKPTSNPISAALNADRDVLEMSVDGLDLDDTPAWLCFAGTETSSGSVIDIVPNHGGPYRGWLPADGT